MILTEFLSNNATAILLTPIAIGLAHGLGVDPRPFVVAVMLAASNAFATPIGYQTNTFVYNAGGYKFADFVKIGLPLNIITWLAASFLIPFFFPLTPPTTAAGASAVDPRPAAVRIEHEPAVVERHDAGLVRDADHGHAGQTLGDQAVHGGLGGLVQRGAGLVEEQPVRFDQQRAGEGQPLLLARRQHHRPVAALVQPVGEVAERAGSSRLRRSRRRCGWPACPGSRAPRAGCRSADRASAAGTGCGRRPGCGPHPCRTATGRRARETAWSCRCPTAPGSPALITRPDDEVDILEQEIAIGQGDLDIVELEPRLLRSSRPSRPVPGRTLRGAAIASAKRGQPVDDRLPVGQGREQLTNQESEPCTCANAPAVCVSTPSVISPPK